MSPALRTARVAAICFLGACAGPPAEPAAPAAPPSETAAFLVTMGVDTLSAERFTFTGDRLAGETFTRTPRTVSRRYEAELRPDGSIARLEVTARTLTAPPTTPATVTTVEFDGDSARVRIARGDSVTRQTVAAPRGAIPFVGGSYALYEAVMRHMRRTAASASDAPLVVPGAQPIAARIELGPESGFLTNIAGRSAVRTDAVGRILSLDGSESTQKVRVTRMPELDVAALATAFAQREAAGRGLGVLSPRDSAVLEVGGARIVVDYGRPSRRGREVMEEIVPYDQVWRTGANAATGLRTTRDLGIGGVHVPAGAYTLWTLPGREGWKLIINRQTGQWGTEYHAEQDLARVEMAVGSAATPVESFTISLEPAGAGAATLRMAWGSLVLSAPIEVH